MPAFSLTRRQLIQTGLGALVGSSALAGCVATTRHLARPDFISAVDLTDDQHAIAGANASHDGLPGFDLPVAERCHGGCARPQASQVVMFARRPGRHAYVLDTAHQHLHQVIAAGAGYHFYGHGVFSRDGRFLYATLNHYGNGQGLVRVYDADNEYQAVRDLSLDGIGPHELRLHPDGEHLLVALGGIRTHPDYARIKLNLDTMRPAVLMINCRTGAIVRRWRPSDTQLSCRHLDVSDDGIAMIGYQYQGPTRNNPPLIARLDTGTGALREVNLDPALQRRLRHYTSSVVISRNHPFAVVASPWGGLALMLNYQTGALLQAFELTDVSGALAEAGGTFVVSSGLGGLYRIRADDSRPAIIARASVRWDHHLIAI